MPLPDCMAPDGAEPCQSYSNLRLALENARRDLNGLCPRSDTGSKRKKIIESAIARIDQALQQN